MADEHIDVGALVLGHLDAHARRDAVTHLVACPACRSEYDDMAATLSELLPAVPAMQPPLGFDGRVLAQIGVAPRVRPRAMKHRVLGRVLGAAAAIVLIAGAAIGWWAVTHDSSTAGGQVAALELTNGGTQVGTVSVGDVRGETVMVVALVDAPDGVSYRCRTTFADGTVSESDPWPAAYGAWIVPLPDSPSAGVDTVQLLVDGTDHVWSAATFSD